MKKLTRFFICLLIAAISFSCSKTKPAETQIRITVQEYKTNIPVHDALVELYEHCASCAFQPAYNIVFSTRTDGDGHCEVPVSKYNNVTYGTLITPTPTATPDVEYWSAGSPAAHSSDTIYYLPAVGEEEFHIMKKNGTPKGQYMEFFEEGELHSFVQIDIARVYGFPSDSSFSFYSYRGQTCKITWNIYDSTGTIISSGGPVAVDIQRTGSQQVDINY